SAPPRLARRGLGVRRLGKFAPQACRLDSRGDSLGLYPGELLRDAVATVALSIGATFRSVSTFALPIRTFIPDRELLAQRLDSGFQHANGPRSVRRSVTGW